VTPREATGGNRGRPDSLRQGSRIPLGQRISALAERMRTCIDAGKPLDLSDAAHREITEALHALSYEQGSAPKDSGQLLKVAYGDGSKGAPLSVRCLSLPQYGRVDEKYSPHVGTLSFRHLVYDDRIDYYLIRDRETRTLSNGEVDELAYTRMRELVQDPALRRQDSQLVLLQTGLVPLVVGVYRALIEELIFRHSSNLPILVVQPIFYADEDRTGRGQAWA